jgi:hypothetical protein
MTDAHQVFERRLLASLEQAAGVELPAAWRQRPGTENLRPAAAVVLRVATCGSRDEMARYLRETTERIAANREGRTGGEQELWSSLAGAVGQLGETREGAAGLLGLRLWDEVRGIPVSELWRLLRDLLPGRPAADELFLTEVARVLLRALAKRWSQDARQEEGA